MSTGKKQNDWDNLLHTTSSQSGRKSKMGLLSASRASALPKSWRSHGMAHTFHSTLSPQWRGATLLCLGERQAWSSSHKEEKPKVCPVDTVLPEKITVELLLTRKTDSLAHPRKYIHEYFQGEPISPKSQIQFLSFIFWVHIIRGKGLTRTDGIQAPPSENYTHSCYHLTLQGEFSV